MKLEGLEELEMEALLDLEQACIEAKVGPCSLCEKCRTGLGINCRSYGKDHNRECPALRVFDLDHDEMDICSVVIYCLEVNEIRKYKLGILPFVRAEIERRRS